MDENMVTLLAAIGGAVVGALLTYLFTAIKAKKDLRLAIAKGMLSYLALVLNRSAPEVQSENAEALRQEWDRCYRELYLVGVPEKNRSRLGDCMAAYLQALERFNKKKETRDEVERLRKLAKIEAHTFLDKMGLSVK